ncbi:uncharacterized protein Dwil_GK22093 [Drosophila willistoni]|uniref:Uncharacterized protein n=1 Tax=Drosophila willistoni TaxID=7260 RepID=B4MYD2_DROWI|nr:uncharacterized protein LOC6643414 [Drosophila willistoni]EDW77121.2 uncharacterized protein Dwil_GK22093 [Drosophila willistoni]
MFLGLSAVQGVAKFTNVQCLSLDQNFTTFSLCRLYAVKRDVVEMSLRANIIHFPQYPIEMRMQLLKRASGYKPFLYDVSQRDVCEYLQRRNHPFVNIILNSFANRTNIKKCPLQHELILERFRFPVKALEMLPLPTGDYALYTTFSFDSMERAWVKAYFTLTEFR